MYKCKASNLFGNGSVTIKLIKLAQTTVTFDQNPVEARNNSKVTFSPRITVDPYFGANYTVKWTNLRSNNTKLSTGEQLVIENAVIFKDDGNYEVRVATAQDEARVSKFYDFVR